MTLPVGMTTSEFTFSGAFTASGAEVKATATAQPTADVVWAPTGQRLVQIVADQWEAAAGDTTTFELPDVDQVGWEIAGVPVSGEFGFKIELNYGYSKSNGRVLFVAPNSGDAVVSLEDLPTGNRAYPLVTLPVPGDEGPPGAPGGSDASFATWIETPGTDTRDALDAFVPARVRSDLVHPAGRRKVSVPSDPGFFVKGINLGLKGTSFYDSWGTSWDQAWMLDGLQKIHDLGANSTRINGHFRAWLNNPTQYEARLEILIERCRELNLKVIVGFLNTATTPGEYVNWATYQNDYKAMVDAIAGAHIGDDVILAWDVGNELNHGISADITVIQNLSTYIRSVDSTHLVTASQSPATLAEMVTAITDIDAYVDFHDLHYYLIRTVLNLGPGVIEWVTAHTAKPVLFGEFGANAYGTAGVGGPHPGGQLGQAAQVAAFRRHMAGGNVMGSMLWKIKDTAGSTTLMGLYDSSGNPTPQIDEWLGYPSQRLDAAKDYVDFRPHPVISDTFDRVASTTVVGLPDVGHAGPTALSGTWGIKASPGGLYVGTKAGSTSDKLYWDCRTRQTPDCSAEFVLAGFTGFQVGLLFHVTDASNFYVFRLDPHSSIATNYQVSLLSVVAGVVSTLSSVAVVGLSDGDTGQVVRLSARLTAASGAFKVNGQTVLRASLSALTPNGNRGVLIGTADTTSYVQTFQSLARQMVA